MKRSLSILSLFTSSATLICCALPALLVTLGAGAALAGLIGSFPQLIWFSENKRLVFALGGILLLAAGLTRWLTKERACPVDEAQAARCRQTRDFSGWIYILSVAVYLVGAFFAFAAPYLPFS